MTTKMNKLAALSVSIAAVAAAATPAFATDGYFSNGFGARQKALAGAGVADGKDATTISLNPAGLTNVGTEASMSMTVFSPRREYNGDANPGFTPNGTVESGNNWFYIPNMALSYRLAPGSLVDVIGVQMYGNGGMNTDYPAVPSATCAGLLAGFGMGTGSGTFCGGKTGVNLQQALLSIAFAKAFGNISVGVAPTIARQTIEIEGLQLFNLFSNSPGYVSNNGTNSSWGGGVRAGLEWKVMPGVRVGVAGNTPMWMTNFKEYKGLFADNGSFDIPASMQAGIAYDVNPALTVMFDYRHIWYGSVGGIANPSTNIINCALGGGPGGLNSSSCLGGANGVGFGWSDVDVFKFGVEYKMNPALTLRAGYAYNTAALSSRDVMFNILAPATVQHHITGGLEYKYDRNWSFELAGAYVPRVHVSGPELAIPTPIGVLGNPAHKIDVSMEQFEVTFGVKYKFGGVEPAYAPMK